MWTSSGLTHGQTDAQTDAGNVNAQRAKLASGKNLGVLYLSYLDGCEPCQSDRGTCKEGRDQTLTKNHCLSACMALPAMFVCGSFMLGFNMKLLPHQYIDPHYKGNMVS